MRTVTGCVLVLLLATVSSQAAGCGGARVPSGNSPLLESSGTGGGSAPALSHLATHEMQSGTHRPELLVNGDRLYLVVVEHLQREEKRVRHMGYTFEPGSGRLDAGFPVSCETEEYGQGADHRAVIVGDEIVVVYQSNIMDPSREYRGGPMEQYASSQSLLLSRFSADDGRELFRGPVVERATDFEDDNFPDFCILPGGDRLLVSTGSGGGYKMREVDMEGNVLSTVGRPVSRSGVPSSIGNSMLYGPDGRILLFSSTHTPEGGNITVATLDQEYNAVAFKEFETQGRDDSFPTGVLYRDGYYFVGYGSRNDWSGSVEEHPYSPYLMVIDAATMETVADLQVSDRPGAGHSHPTLAVLGDRLFYAWSTRAEDPGSNAPQVLVEEYELK
ncbi:MAG: hypothetical protein V1748_00480 [Actinomycetota bacterium]